MAKRFSVEAVFRGIDKVSKPVRSMGRSVSDFVRQSNKDIAKLGERFKALGALIGKGVKFGVATASAGIAGLGAAIYGLVSQYSTIENAEAAFTPLLGSAKKATELVDKLNITAATTPFQFENLADTANQLLPIMKGNIKNTIKTIRMLGDTAGGNAQKLESVTRGYTKAMLKGKVDMESLNMIAEAGVPIFDDLAKVMGTKVGTKFFKTISAGKVKTEQLTKAFENMTSKGGIFFQGMGIASRTTTGVISTMKDNISLAAASLGKILAPIVKDYANKITETAKVIKAWIQANEGLIKQKIDTFIKGIVSAIELIISVSKALIPIFKQVADYAIMAFGWVKWAWPWLKPFIATLLVWKGILIGLAIAFKIVVAAIGLFNAIMAVNPITLIVIGIAVLIASLKLLYDNWDIVVAAIKNGISYIWNWFSGLLDNPFFAAISTIFLPFITIPALIYKHWEPIKAFFTSIWQGLIMGFEKAMEIITSVMTKIQNLPGIKTVLDFLGVNTTEQGNAPAPVTPQERISRSFQTTENKSTLTIHDNTGRAELSKQPKSGPRIALATSGGR